MDTTNDNDIDIGRLTQSIVLGEGTRTKVYDDATGKPIVPGTVVVGHPTIGNGRALDINGLRPSEISVLTANDITALIPVCAARIPFWSMLNGVRKEVLIEMAFNLGINGLLGFKKMMAAAATHDWQGAADQMVPSTWATQVGARAERLQARFRSGVAS